MSTEAAPLRGAASRTLRDRFLRAVEADDYAVLRVVCGELRQCTDIVPRSVCVSLGLPRNSTYAVAARTIFAP